MNRLTFEGAPSSRKTWRPDEPQFPTAVAIKGRLYVSRNALERYKAELQAFALGVAPVEPLKTNPDRLVPLKVISDELGVGRRTIGRRIAESQASKPAAAE
ncbi:hypothetical protein [Rhodoblastus sp.]|uniref:hypothetical protein n=1 Tax=Rhodoblastus sp. TaxID=1962975 RepID=UPI003F9B484E